MDKLYFLEPKLNKIKIIITLLIIALLLGIITFVLFKFYNNNQNSNILTSQENSTFLIDNNFTITIDPSYKLKEFSPMPNFLLELHSENNFNIYINKLENPDNYSLYMISKADLSSYPSNFQNVTELSELKNSTLNGFDSYNYDFKYLDPTSSITYFMNIFFTQIRNSIYVFNFDFPVSNYEQYKNQINSIVSTISIK